MLQKGVLLMKVLNKKILCILLMVLTIFLSACNSEFAESDIFEDRTKSFESISDMRGFYSANKHKINGGFLCLDLEGENQLHIYGYNQNPIHTFTCTSVENNEYIDPYFVSEYRIYAEELGTDTDIEQDLPYHSITVCFISSVYTNPFGSLKYEFKSVNKGMWNNVVKIYSSNECIAKMYYYTNLNIEQEWIESFLSKYIDKVFW